MDYIYSLPRIQYNNLKMNSEEGRVLAQPTVQEQPATSSGVMVTPMPQTKAAPLLRSWGYLSNALWLII